MVADTVDRDYGIMDMNGSVNHCFGEGDHPRIPRCLNFPTFHGAGKRQINRMLLHLKGYPIRPFTSFFIMVLIEGDDVVVIKLNEWDNLRNTKILQ